TIHNICAYPNPNYNQLTTINLVKRLIVETNTFGKVNGLSENSDNEISGNSNNERSGNFNRDENSNNETIGKGQNTIFIKPYGQDLIYYGKIIVGNQEFNIILDTGSSDLWIPNKKCTSATCQNHNIFDSSKSQIFNPEGKPWNITYSTGYASGVTGIDNIQIGNLTAINQTFGLANCMSDFTNNEADGILGLAFDVVNTIDKEITFTPIIRPKRIREGFWTINLEDVTVNGHSLKLSRDAIIDIGAAFITIPQDDAAAIHKKIPGFKFNNQTGHYVIPCNTKAVVSLKFGGVNYSISHRDLISLPITDTQCIKLGQDPRNFWIVGQTFLRGVYSAFDVNKKVGFAHSK
ncbi:24806_t:CDS:2, partial [Gigaspora margarita]